MALSLWNFLCNKLFSWLEIFTKTPYWKSKLAFFTIIYILFTSFPEYQVLVKMDTGGKRLAARLEMIDWIGAHPFEAIPDSVFVGKVLNDGDKSHFKKRIVRPLIPASLHALGLQARHYIIVQFLIGVLFVVFLINLLSKYLSPVASVIATFMFANLFVTKWTFYDFFYHDPLGYLILLIIAFYRSPLLIALGMALGGFVDERTVIGGTAIVLWWYWHESNYQKVPLRALFSIRKYRATWAAMGGIILFVLLRALIQFLLSFKADISMITFQYNSFLMGLTVTYECAWFLLIGVVLAMIANKDWLLLTLYLISALSVIMVGSIVLDHSRSYAYGFVLVLLALVYLYKSESKLSFQHGLTFCAIGCFLFPTYNQISWFLFWMPPIYPKIKVLLTFYGLI
ncbi:hypothetical protein P1X15_21105 [Runella sp. MFBS21]|uniref:hypothetical protein n=1 Tax=Runella sp. MFBS21 TaxID=3034018 RepID=UPI0023F97B5B|nr:hypothetical protein [Runella sp. MFBS21]MDF7820131.1 hypothetical protein [Runella sp. MFBS21]